MADMNEVERVEADLALSRWFSDETADDILARVRAQWTFVAGFPFPRGSLPIRCPQCRTEDVKPRLWRFFEPTGQHRVARRADVGFKCQWCGHVFEFGIPVPPEVPSPSSSAKVIRWREAREMIKEARNAEG